MASTEPGAAAGGAPAAGGGVPAGAGPRARTPGPALALVRAAHAGPTLVVTAVTALLAVAAELPAQAALVVTAAVLAGQLTIGWGNDLRDADRDAAVGRSDKPLAAGELDRALVRRALGVAAAACVLLSPAAGWRSAVLHLGLVVASGHAYNLRLKSTAASWLPYAVAFGALPAVVTRAGPDPRWPALYVVVAGACLGVGAHVLNALPDLADDAATGVHGLPHRLGARRSRLLAAALLGGASLATVLGPPGPPRGAAVPALAVAAALVAGTLLGRGRAPFLAAMALAVLDLALLAGATG
ncbi:MAG TPA: UbiA family prenyltransferase [Dermatophilaceae bacterium]|nr:UbiA family prenyltransferase [Dermatophilaceae bacterium]